MQSMRVVYMLSPLLICFGILAILVYQLYGGAQHKIILQIFLSAISFAWIVLGYIPIPSNESQSPSVAKVVVAPENHSLAVASSPRYDASANYAEYNSNSCDAPLLPADMHSVGCKGGCVSLGDKETINVCNYTRIQECSGSIKQKIKRYVATTYPPIQSSHSSPHPEYSKSSLKFHWPAKGRIIYSFTDGGDGINIALPNGTEVKATEEGEVAFAGSEIKGYGKMILIRHTNGFVSAYAHNGELLVKRGDKVARGQTIAKSGESGYVTQPQLHFELRKDSQPLDPTIYLARL